MTRSTQTTLTVEDHPILLFEHQGKPALFAKQIGDALGLAKPCESLARSKTLLERVDYTLESIHALPVEPPFPAPLGRATLVRLSGLFLWLPRIKNERAVRLLRQVTQEIERRLEGGRHV